MSWLHPYSTLRGANVKGTRNVIKVSTFGDPQRPLSVTFLSTISVTQNDIPIGNNKTILCCRTKIT